jgi:hypothetical protein
MPLKRPKTTRCLRVEALPCNRVHYPDLAPAQLQPGRTRRYQLFARRSHRRFTLLYKTYLQTSSILPFLRWHFPAYPSKFGDISGNKLPRSPRYITYASSQAPRCWNVNMALRRSRGSLVSLLSLYTPMLVHFLLSVFRPVQ